MPLAIPHTRLRAVFPTSSLRGVWLLVPKTSRLALFTKMLPAGSRRSKIRPPRRPLAVGLGSDMNDSAVDFDKSWAVLSHAITQIQNKNVSNLSYEQLYRKAYALVLRKFGSRLYDNVSQIVLQHLLEKREQLLSATSDLAMLDRDDFLKRALNVWDDHLKAMKYISDVLMYLNRVYVKENKKMLVYDLGIQLFKNKVVLYNDNELGQKIVSIVYDELTRCRNGELISTKLQVISLISMFEQFPETPSQVTVAGKDVQFNETYYMKYFEPSFLSVSETYFNKLSLELVARKDGSVFLHEVESFIAAEEERLNTFVPEATIPKVILLMNNIIIKDKISSIIDLPLEAHGLSYWLEPVVTNVIERKRTFADPSLTSQVRDLSILYKLIDRIDPEVALLKSTLREIIPKQGVSILNHLRNKMAPTTPGSKKVMSSSHPSFTINWVESILELQNQYASMVAAAFNGNPSIEQCVAMAVRNLVNNPTPSGDPTFKINAPELLSIYMDHNIKQLSKSGGQSKVPDLTINAADETEQFVMKFRYFLRVIKDKDAFEVHYANHFARRFLNAKDLSLGRSGIGTNRMGIDLEDYVLSKLGEELGSSSLEKVLKMNKDIRLSRDLTRDWKSHVSQNAITTADLDLKLCNVSEWPKSMTKDYKRFGAAGDTESLGFIWPRQLRNVMHSFEDFWHAGKKNENKSLYWSPKFGSVDMRIRYPSKTYEINMSVYAAVIMLVFAPGQSDGDAFQEGRQLSYLEIKELTGIADSDLKRQLQSIAVAPRLRLLIKLPMSKDVKDDDVFKLNSGFKSPTVRVKVLTVSASSSVAPAKSKSSEKTEKEEEIEDVEKSIMEGRKFELNAAIVRILKSRQQINHNDLIAELVKQLLNRFQPLTLMMKQRIEDLIDKEYMKRDAEERNLYHYVA